MCSTDPHQSKALRPLLLCPAAFLLRIGKASRTNGNHQVIEVIRLTDEMLILKCRHELLFDKLAVLFTIFKDIVKQHPSLQNRKTNLQSWNCVMPTNLGEQWSQRETSENQILRMSWPTTTRLEPQTAEDAICEPSLLLASKLLSQAPPHHINFVVMIPGADFWWRRNALSAEFPGGSVSARCVT